MKTETPKSQADYCRIVLPKKHESPSWDAVAEADVRKAIGKHFPVQPPHPTGFKPERWNVVDKTHEMMIEAKSDRAKAALLPFLSALGQPKILTVNPGMGATVLSMDHLAPALGIAKASRTSKSKDKSRQAETNIAVSMGHEMAATIETVDWRILIAPRIVGNE